MFERFTDHARRSVVLASETARAHHHDHLGTEHLLVGLLRARDGVAAASLTAVGLTADAIDGKLSDTGPGEPGSSGHIPFTAHAKAVIEQSLRERSLLGHDRIGTEHLLLALIDNRTSTGARMLDEAVPVDLVELRRRILHHVAEHRRESGPAGPSHLVTIRLTDAEHGLCTDAAGDADQPLETWMRERILDAARAHGTEGD